MSNNQTTITKDGTNKKIFVVREFNAPLEEVWRAWTEKDLLDLWWAPKPWKAKTKSMYFREGGFWLYAMVGPDGTASWCRADFKSIAHNKSFSMLEYFCDEDGDETNELPRMYWTNVFTSTDEGTRVVVEITFESGADMDKIIEMGFEEGFTAAHTNLDELLAK